MKSSILKYKLILFLLFIISGQVFTQTSVIIDPMANFTSIGNTTTLSFKINNVTNLYSYIITVKFNNSVVKFIDASKGSFLNGNDVFFYQPAANLVLDSVVLTQSKIGPISGVTGSGILFTMTFQGLINGINRVYFSKIELRDANNTLIPCTNMFGNIIVGALYANINIFLQGPYNASSGNMNTSLNSSGYLPNAQPYNQSPWNYNGNEFVPSGFYSMRTILADWVLIELRQSPSGNAVSKRAAFIRNDGQIVDCVDGVSNLIFTNVTAGNYYLVVRHRNHLSVMSANTVSIGANPALYNFSTSLSQFYGGDAQQINPGIYGMYAGDANASGFINAVDRNLVFLNTGQLGYLMSDVNLSGFVNAADRNIIILNTGKVTNVP